MRADSPKDVADRAVSALGPEVDVIADPDLAGLGHSFGAVVAGLPRRPLGVGRALADFAASVGQIPGAALARWLGADPVPPVPIDPKDRRFGDRAWQDNPAFYALRLTYLALARLVEGMVDASAVDPKTREKARVFANFLVDASAPTNFLATNPAALKRAFESGGVSLVRGLVNLLDDVAHNGGRPRQVDRSSFSLGVNLAATPGKVVYRNDLMELMQYSPQTEKVHANPLLASPPWINKYYVMDLAPDRSFIEWAVRHGRTVFAISYRNPTPEMSGVTLDDYLIEGPKQALDVVQEITGAPTVDIVGLCLGGAMTVITAAYLTAVGDDRIGSVTLLNTLLDYGEPGVLGVFTDEETVNRVERRLDRDGYLSGESMAGTFDLLRANDLIFNYVVSNWLMGQAPPSFDILAWNSDSTRMPAAMHSFYLRNFYVKNLLAAGKLELAGERIDLATLDQDTYVVSAENDHIVPWRSAYRTTGLVSGRSRFVLSSGGHVAGIVNPPNPKAWYLVGDGTPPDPDEWRALAERRAGSWWEDWASWSTERAGDLVDPPPMGSASHPVLGNAPGEYVRE